MSSEPPKLSLERMFEETKSQRTSPELRANSDATPFSRFFWAAIRYMQSHDEREKTLAESQFADDLEWYMMNNGQIRRGKAQVLPFLWAGGFGSAKTPEPICNRVTKDFGIWEYWNVGVISQGIVEFARQSKWRFPHDPATLIGRKYAVPVCFIYSLNDQGKIRLVREYLDTQSLMTHFE